MKTTYTINTDQTNETINEITAELRAQGNKEEALMIRKVYSNLKDKTFTSTNVYGVLASWTGKKVSKEDAKEAIKTMLSSLVFDEHTETEELVEVPFDEEANIKQMVETPFDADTVFGGDEEEPFDVGEEEEEEKTDYTLALISRDREFIKEVLETLPKGEERKVLKQHLKSIKKDKIAIVNTMGDAAKVVTSIVDKDILKEERNFLTTRLGKAEAWKQLHSDNKEIVINLITAIKWVKLRGAWNFSKQDEVDDLSGVLVHSYTEKAYSAAFEALQAFIEENSSSQDNEDFMEVYKNQEAWYHSCLESAANSKDINTLTVAKRVLYTHQKKYGDIHKDDVSKNEWKAIQMISDFRKPIKAF